MRYTYPDEPGARETSPNQDQDPNQETEPDTSDGMDDSGSGSGRGHDRDHGVVCILISTCVCHAMHANAN